MKPYQFLVDANLPMRIKFFQNDAFKHQVDINPSATDSSIWETAIQEIRVILTRDTDFLHRCRANPEVQVVFFRLGNIRLRDFYEFLDAHWNEIIDKLDIGQLIEVTREEIHIIIPKK